MSTQALVGDIVQELSVILSEELRKFLNQSQRKKRRFWVRQWILRRNQLGASNSLLKELAMEDKEGYRNHLRMSESKFDELLLKIENKIKKKDTFMREAILPKLKLQITLRYLATGDSFQTLAFTYRVPKNTISNFLKEVLMAIHDGLEEFIKIPQNKEEWKTIQREYYHRWNFPNCCGAIDGKHIVIRNPPHSGSEYFNYKGSFSIILFACVDANYCFRYYDIGTNGRANDASVFTKSSLNMALEDYRNELNFPEEGVIVADDAFPLREYILKPYGRSTYLSRKQKIFNYRLSRARRVVENAFGILVSRFRVFEKPIAIGLDKVDALVKAALALHNWLKMTTGESYTPVGSIDIEDLNGRVVVPGSWRNQPNRIQGLQNLEPNHFRNRNHSRLAHSVREKYAEYFSGPGAVPWQLDMIHDG
uniref:Nuclease HARBI1 n=1 Tax=Cacopsylla melanoneura TaxID=428564 RepID=A0A8D8TUQ0_9HEMI